VANFTTVACRISSRLKRYKYYKNQLRLAKVILKNKLPHFLWFTVYINIKSISLYSYKLLVVLRYYWNLCVTSVKFWSQYEVLFAPIVLCSRE